MRPFLFRENYKVFNRTVVIMFGGCIMEKKTIWKIVGGCVVTFVGFVIYLLGIKKLNKDMFDDEF